jgi:hypothetical protein
VKIGRSTRKVCVGLALALSLIASERAAAQAYRYGAGWTAGGTYLTALNPSSSAVALEPDPGFLVGLHLERGYGSTARWVVRYQAAYQAPRFDWAGGKRQIDAFSADVAFLARIIDPSSEGAFLPYLMIGAGGIWYDLGRGPSTTYAPANAYHNGESIILPLGAVGLGVDVPIGLSSFDAAPVRIRLEAADHVTLGSPLHRVSDRERYGPVHHVRFTVGAWAAIELIR